MLISAFSFNYHDEEGKGYTMGLFYDIAGKGSAIRNIDTVQRQTDGSYSGKHSHILSEKGALYLVNTRNKTRKLLLDTVSARAMNHDLNNAYHLGQYNDMSVRLNDAFPLNDFTFREELYFPVINNKTAVNRIRQVQGHGEVKKMFMKERKNDQWFRVYALGMFAGTVSAVTYMVMKLL